MHDNKISTLKSSLYSNNVREINATWQKSLANMITDPQELLEMVGLAGKINFSPEVGKAFPLRVTREFASRIKPHTPNDPLLRQVLPVDEELIVKAGFVADALQEKNANPHPGLLHKYNSRVLFIATGSCAIHCRYCFRRDFPYAMNNPGRAGWQEALDYVRNNSSIEEVILSGGDPLMIPDNQLRWFINEFEAIPHLQRLRFHTRLPVVLPQRITEQFVQLLTDSRLQSVIVIHSNHAQEIDDEVKAALHRLRQANIALLNQSVLLAGVNDNAASLIDLSKALFSAGVMPYYLHLLDPVAGVGHYHVPLETAKILHREMQHSLSGYLVPKLAQEVAGEKAKMLVL
jgi:EF-P beta-lysylation protein EpmB